MYFDSSEEDVVEYNPISSGRDSNNQNLVFYQNAFAMNRLTLFLMTCFIYNVKKIYEEQYFPKRNAFD